MNAHLRALLSSSATSLAGSATASARPGKPAPAPMSAIAPRRLQGRQIERDERIREVDIQRLLRRPHRCRRLSVLREQLQQAGELLLLARAEPMGSRERRQPRPHVCAQLGHLLEPRNAGRQDVFT